MSRIQITPDARLTDTLERDLLTDTMTKPRSALPAIKRAARRTAHAVGTFFDYVDSVHQAVEKNRRNSGFYAGAQW
jgi:hypothetical protein